MVTRRKQHSSQRPVQQGPGRVALRRSGKRFISLYRKPRHDAKAVQPSSCRIVLISDPADCWTLLSFRPCLTVLTKTSCEARPLCSTGVTPLHRYYKPSRHPLAFHRLPGWRASGSPRMTAAPPAADDLEVPGFGWFRTSANRKTGRQEDSTFVHHTAAASNRRSVTIFSSVPSGRGGCRRSRAHLHDLYGHTMWHRTMVDGPFGSQRSDDGRIACCTRRRLGFLSAGVSGVTAQLDGMIAEAGTTALAMTTVPRAP